MPRVRHYFEPGGFYHLTTRTLNGAHTFASEEAKRAVVEALAFYRKAGQWRVHAFVVMANHVHAVISETGAGLKDAIRDFKKWVWHEMSAAGNGPLWERRYDDNAVRSAREMKQVIEYDHNNPVRIGLVRRPEDYFWSSARNYAGLTPVAMEVDMAW
ncbi:MAG: transposase [Planctomycetes bacterium]|nr:transposase [Planctomycetota bacterium]